MRRYGISRMYKVEKLKLKTLIANIKIYIIIILFTELSATLISLVAECHQRL